MQAAPHPNRSKRPSENPTSDSENFGDQVTSDSADAQAEIDCGLDGSKTIIVVKDRATDWIDCFVSQIGVMNGL